MQEQWISKEDVRKIQLELLATIDDIAKKNGITYSLSGGSLLGAVRHQGFIPWDDDVDLMATRLEYEKLVDAIEIDNRYTVIRNTNQSDQVEPFAFTKIVDKRTAISSFNDIPSSMGVFIDIFPIDGIPNGSDSENNKYTRKINTLLKRATRADKRFYWEANSLKLAKIKKVILKPEQILLSMLKPSLQRMLDVQEQMAKYSVTDTQFSAWLGGFYNEKYESSIFSDYEDIAFENIQLSAIVRRDEYLTSLYGDYMVLPPVENRVVHSKYKYYWKDEQRK